jgi:sarcosine oxidase, subunit beta
MNDIAESAEVVIIGGGVIGSSVAYHLTRAGVQDIIVLERNELSSGATARSAGCLSHSRSDRSTIRMISRTRAAISELEELLGESLDFRQVGCIRSVLSEERELELRAMESCLDDENLPVQPIDANEARSLCPWLELDPARRIVYLASDGYIDGARLGIAYARAARMQGAQIRRGVTVHEVLVEDGSVLGVATDRGVIKSRWVVNAGGAWGAQVGLPISATIAAAPTRSHYWITAPDGSGRSQQPNVQLPDMRAYLRSEVGGMLVGLQEPRSRTYDPLELVADMGEMTLTDEEYDLDLLLEQATALSAVIPDVNRWGFAHHIVGLSMYTPDGKFVLGPRASFKGLLVAGGCCGSGVAASGGFGQSIAELITGLPVSIDVSLYDPDRFGDADPSSDIFRQRCAAARSGKSRGHVDPVATMGA